MNDQAPPMEKRHVMASTIYHALVACAGIHLLGALRQEDSFVDVAVSVTVIVSALTAVMLLGGRYRSTHERSHATLDGASRPWYECPRLLSNWIASLLRLLVCITMVLLVGWWAYWRVLGRMSWSFTHIVVLYVGVLYAAIVIARSIDLIKAHVRGRSQ